MSVPGSGPTVVVADDEAPIRLVVTERLKAAGYRVFEARDGEEALAHALRESPTAVITDLQMPYMNGLELAMRLKKERATANTSVLLLTARGHILSDEQLAQTNIRKVMCKPFSVRDLLAYVQTSLAPTAEAAATR